MTRLLPLTLLCAGSLLAQGVSVSALRGTYHYQMLQASLGGPGTPAEVRSHAGWVSFDGSGGLTYNTGRGSYLLDEKGFAVLPSPVNASVTLNARAAPDSGVLIGSSTESGGVFNLFVAVRAPEGSAPVTLKGAYRAVALIFPGPRTSAARSAYTAFQASDVTTQLGPDGRGTLTLPLNTPLPIREYNILAGEGGGLLIGSPKSATGLFIAVPEAAEDPSGTYWVGELAVERGRIGASAGSLRIEGRTRARLSQRWATTGGVFDFRGVNSLTLQAPGAGLLEESPLFSGARGTLVGFTSTPENHSLFFAVRAPVIAAPSSGVFLHPHGVTDAASLAPPGAPLAPGSFVTLFGERLAARAAAASSLPLPESLDGVRVEVNGRAAALHSISPAQVNLLLPVDLDGDSARFVVRNSTGESAPVSVPLVAGAASAFSMDGSGAGAAIVTHADYSLVSAASPARGGEVLLLFATGLGRNQPPVSVLVGGAVAEVLYSGPSSLAGLDQVNFRVPTPARAGNAVPLTLEYRNGYSDMVDFAVTP